MKAQEQKRSASAASTKSDDMKKLLERYGCGPIQFTGTNDALYERHLLFDNVMDLAMVGSRERYEAVARSVRDVLSQRWLRTERNVSTTLIHPGSEFKLYFRTSIERLSAGQVYRLFALGLADRRLNRRRAWTRMALRNETQWKPAQETWREGRRRPSFPK